MIFEVDSNGIVRPIPDAREQREIDFIKARMQRNEDNKFYEFIDGVGAALRKQKGGS